MKRIFLMIMVLVVSINLCTTPLMVSANPNSKEPFLDVKTNFWAYDCICEMVERGVLSGYPDGNFYPNKTVTRAEFAKIMCLAAGLPVNPVGATSYVDVEVTDWYAPYVECGRYYLSGYVINGEKYYAANQLALREDIAVAMVKLKGYSTAVYDESVLKVMFTDWQSISEGARKYVSVAVENGLISGYEDKTFRGQSSITRAEAATLLWRAYQYGNGNKVFEKEEDVDMPVNLSQPSETETPDIKPVTEPTEESIPEQKLKLSLSVDKGNFNVEKGENVEISVTIKCVEGDFKAVSELGLLKIEDGSDILSSKNGDEDKRSANSLTMKFSTKELETGKYNIKFSVKDDYTTTTKTVTINVVEPEPEYTYEMDTLLKDVQGVLIMVATNDSVVCLIGYEEYLGGDYWHTEYGKVVEIKNTGTEILLDQDNVEYLGNEVLSKEELATRYRGVEVHALGYNEYDKCPYAIVSQMGYYYLYNLYTGETQELSDEHRASPFNTMFCINKIEEIVYGHEINNRWYDGAVTIDGVVYSTRSMSYIDNRTGNSEAIDYYISKGAKVFAANNNYHYAIDEKFQNVYLVDTDGEYEHLFSAENIDNKDGRTIDLDYLEIHVGNGRQNSAVDNEGTIYFYDGKYSSVRCIRKR